MSKANKQSLIISLGKKGWTMLVVLGVLIVGGYFYYSQKNNSAVSATVAPGVVIDEIPGWWYKDNFGASVCENDNCKMESDPDEDKLTNAQEYYYKTNPNVKDTNQNGLADGEDVSFNYDPSKPGKVTFDEAATDDTVLGESLLFDKDVKGIISDLTDLSKIKLPEINELQLKISKTSSKDQFLVYMAELDTATKKYFTTGISAQLENILKSNNVALIQDMSEKAKMLEGDLKQIEVPADAVMLHKYNIAFWQVVPSVINSPDTNAIDLSSNYNDELNKWYDSAQLMVAISQKMDIEAQRLSKKYEQ